MILAAAGQLLGIEIGGTKLQIVAGAEPGRIERRWRADVDPAAGGAGVQRQIEQGLSVLLRERQIAAVEVGFGGPVDHRTGQVCRSHQIEGWDGFPLGDWLARQMRSAGGGDTSVVVENDANAAALGEALHGAGRGHDPVLYMTLGSGVGGGLVSGGSIYHGAVPGEAEIGHLRLNIEGATVESECSGWAIDRKIRRIAMQSTESFFGKAASGKSGGEARHLAAGIAARDPAAQSILGELALNLALALSHVVHLMHPEVIVIGGGLSLIGESLRKAIEEALPRLVIEAFHPAPQIRLALLGEDAVPVGAMQLARMQLGAKRSAAMGAAGLPLQSVSSHAIQTP